MDLVFFTIFTSNFISLLANFWEIETILLHEPPHILLIRKDAYNIPNSGDSKSKPLSNLNLASELMFKDLPVFETEIGQNIHGYGRE